MRSIFVLVSIIFLFFLIVALPKVMVTNQIDKEVTEYGLLENEYRKTVLQVIAGGGVLFGLFVAYRRMKATEKQLENTATQIQLLQEGQINDRFSRAAELLGNDKLEVRIGALITLEGLANEKKEFRDTITKIIIAFVNRRAKIDVNKRKNLRKVEEDIKQALEIGIKLFYQSSINNIELFNIYLPSSSFVFKNDLESRKTIFIEDSLIENSLLSFIGANRLVIRNSNLTNTEPRVHDFSSQMNLYNCNISNSLYIDSGEGEIIIKNSIIEDSCIAITKRVKINKCLFGKVDFDLLNEISGTGRIRNCIFREDNPVLEFIDSSNKVEPIEFGLKKKEWINR